MIALITYLAQRGLGLLEVILHIGAHRTGTTSFQRALQQNQHNLSKNGVVVWGPRITRGGRFSGLLRGMNSEAGETERLVNRNKGVIAIELERMDKARQHSLLVSEENILGSMVANLSATRLYPRLDERLARFTHAFGSACTIIGLAIRPYEDYWASSMAYAIKAGHPVLGPDDLDRLVTQPRGWRRVVGDVAAAFPKAQIKVWEFSRLIGRPQAQYRLLAGRRGRLRQTDGHHNASPGLESLREILKLRGDLDALKALGDGQGRFQPFGAHHIDAFQAQYAEDLAWLRNPPKQDFRFIENLGAELATTRKYAKGGLA
ncbi:MAG: hypothetical protein GXP03_03540 [Alphaproteobacteria bacterium]|nr:hypothetical protein [Alphaproteobacteria bacterium]